MLRTLGMSVSVLILLMFAQAPTWVFKGYYLLINLCFWIPYEIALISSMNRDALGFIVKSSEYWIKIVYSAVVAIVLIMMFSHQVAQQRNEVPVFFGYAHDVVALLSSVLFMAFVGALDAVPKMQFKWKAFLIGMTALIYTSQAVQYQFLEPTSDDYVIKIEATGSVVSCHALLANSCGTMALFLWKYVLDVIRNKNRCISITYRPYLRWEIPKNETEMIDHVVPEVADAN